MLPATALEVYRPRLFQPRPEQRDALRALKKARDSGKKRALVVMASGLGKTAVAAFDVRRWLRQHRGSRVLYLCHQNDILAQARRTFVDIIGTSYSYGFFTGREKTPGGIQIVFASFQTVRQRRYRKRFSKHAFDYIVVDESHHVQAKTYRPTLDYFKPKFLLGITATPDRADLKDIRDIYGNEVFSLPLEDALARRLLAKVDYRLMSDELQSLRVLETPIGRLSIRQLNRTLFVPKRDREIVRLIGQRSKEVTSPRTVIFCPSIAYADRLGKLIPHAVPIHTGMSYQQQTLLWSAFEGGQISTILVVDKFNEGVDVPDSNVIVFLRSTASETIFLQQLGRGLRKTAGKKKVLVLDFVANCERLEMVHRLWTNVRRKRGEVVDEGEEQEPISIDVGRVRFDEVVKDVLKVLAAIRGGYTKEILIKQLKDLARELGRTPTSTDVKRLRKVGKIAGVESFARLFGSFHEALQAAGFRVNIRYGRTTKKELLDLLRQLSKNGRTPTVEDVLRSRKLNRTPGPEKFYQAFGSFTKALLEAGIKPSVVKYSRKQLIRQLKSLHRRLGRPPMAVDLHKGSKQGKTASLQPYKNEFGSLRAALVIAGIPQARLGRRYKKSDLILQLKRLRRRVGRRPTQKDIRLAAKQGLCASFGTFGRHFGSFSEALRMAGMTAPRARPHYTDGQLLAHIRVLRKKLHQAPNTTDIQRSSLAGEGPGLATYHSHFGTIARVLKAAGLRMR